MAQNLGRGGFANDEGENEDRWPLISKRVKDTAEKIDLLLLSEAVDWDKSAHRPLVRAANDLDLEPMPLAPSKSGFHTTLLYSKKSVGRWQNWDTGYYEETVHGFGVAGFDIGLPRVLSVVSAHLDPFSCGRAMDEAELLAVRAYRRGPYAIIGGDCNYPSAFGREPDYSKMRPYNMAARTTLDSPNDNPVPDRRVGKMFVKNDFFDVAYEVYKKTRNESLLDRTAKSDRVDQFWVSKPLQPAIVDYWIADDPTEASDHKGIVFQLDTDLIDTSEPWDYQ